MGQDNSLAVGIDYLREFHLTMHFHCAVRKSGVAFFFAHNGEVKWLDLWVSMKSQTTVIYFAVVQPFIYFIFFFSGRVHSTHTHSPLSSWYYLFFFFQGD